MVEQILTHFDCFDGVTLVDKNGLGGRQTLHNLAELDLAERLTIANFFGHDFLELLI